TEPAEFLLYRAHVCSASDAEVDEGTSLLGDHVGARAASDHRGARSDAAALVVEPAAGTKDSRDLQCELVHGVHPVARVNPCMGSAAGDDQFDLAHTLARGLQPPLRAGTGLEHEGGVAPPGFLFDTRSRGLAADFLVGGPQKDDSLLRMEPEPGQCLHGK